MLVPERHPVKDFFVVDVMDVVPKSDVASMEHPIFSLSTKPARRALNYVNGNSKIVITPSAHGLPTVHDQDLLIYCISHLVHQKNQGLPITPHLKIRAHDFFVSTNRDTGGRSYEALVGTLQRLHGTVIETNIVSGGATYKRGIHLIEEYEYLRSGNMHEPEKRLEWLCVTLPQWIFKAVEEIDVLTLSRDYFRIRSPLNRRIYAIARKHCGSQLSWRVSIEVLQKKTGSSSEPKEFARHVRELASANDMPDYALTLEDGGDFVVFHLRKLLSAPKPDDMTMARLDFILKEVAEEARLAARERNRDYQALKFEFLRFMNDKGMPRSIPTAFLGFIRKKKRI